MLAKFFRPALWFCCSALLTSPLLAQQYIPKTITFSGDSHDNPAALLAATKLHPGVAVTANQIRAAAQRLSSTGMFSHVQFTFNGIVLHFVLTPSAGILEPAVYLNFPWWTSAQLTQVVAARVPLFHGMVLPESAMQKQITGALTALVAAKGVHATVTAVPSEAPNGKVDGVSFEIQSPKVVIGSLTLTGASPAFTKDMAAIQKAAGGQPWNSAVQDQIQKALNAVYHRHGYLRDSITSLTHGAPQLSGNKLLVPVQATMREGAQYHFTGLTLAGNPLPASQKALQHSPLHAGEVANAVLLRGLLMAVESPYRAQGHLDAKINAVPTFNHTQHTVSYTVTITPGPVYHFSKLTVTGLSPDQTASVMKRWKIKPGDVFDATYPSKFLLLNKKTLRQLDGWSATYKEYDNTVTHIVYLTMNFKKGGPLK